MDWAYQSSFSIEGGNFENAGKASIEIKKILKNLKISDEILRRTAIVVYESELNIISYADQGVINLSVTGDKILISVDDVGPGIEDIELAMQEGYSTATDRIREMGFGAGMGLLNIKNCSDELQIFSEVNKGTHLSIIINRMERES
ncbi:MAG: ATP-binding protein [Syntrophales bacterium]|jgi:anti-sigma regulatory factor (Ser/Thr protein kinase)|nr:ATP-binding protein [Syntrophales bacterium]MDY0044732.1 ATP-binding protein [Syntrophales bacterium]